MGLVPEGANLHGEAVGVGSRGATVVAQPLTKIMTEPQLCGRGRPSHGADDCWQQRLFDAAYLPRCLGWWRLMAGINQGLSRVVGGFQYVRSRIVAIESGGRGGLTAVDGTVGVVVFVGECVE